MPYKIVSSHGDEEHFRSLTREYSQGGVAYEVGKPTHPLPNCGPLAAFKTLEDVKNFKLAHGWPGSPVFRCKVKKEERESKLFAPHKRREDGVEHFIGTLPVGTILCKKITLIERIS